MIVVFTNLLSIHFIQTIRTDLETSETFTAGIGGENSASWSIASGAHSIDA